MRRIRPSLGWREQRLLSTVPVGILCEVDQMESIWGFTAADLLMRLPSVQECQCECDIFGSWLFAMELELILFVVYIRGWGWDVRGTLMCPVGYAIAYNPPGLLHTDIILNYSLFLAQFHMLKENLGPNNHPYSFETGPKSPPRRPRCSPSPMAVRMPEATHRNSEPHVRTADSPR